MTFFYREILCGFTKEKSKSAENFRFLSWQAKKCFFLKQILSVTCTMESFFSANRWRLGVLTFLIKGFAFYYRHPSLPQKIPFLSQTWSKIHTLVYYLQSWYFQALFFWLGTGYWKESWPEIFLIFKSLVFSRSLSDY